MPQAGARWTLWARRVRVLASPPGPTRQTVDVSNASPGRHRSSVPRRHWWPAPALATVGALLTAAVAAAGFVLWPSNSSPTKAPILTPPSASVESARPSRSQATATVESSSNVTLTGNTVTVEDVSSLVDGETVRAVPSALTPRGLQLIDASVIGADGRARSFTDPVTIAVGGTLTVRSRYRLTQCPDVIPTQWPAPVEFPKATRSYVRLDGPLHTADAICPEAKSAAEPLTGLSGSVLAGDVARVQLNWLGTQSLTVTAIGSASGVAALVPNPDCDITCVASIPPGGSTDVQLQPLDPCPPATESTRLALVVQVNGRTSTVAVEVAGLDKAICS